MTSPDDRTGPAEHQGTPEAPSAPAWMDEVLGTAAATADPPTPRSTPLSGPGDLKIPPTPSEVQAGAQPGTRPQTPPPPPHRGSDWVTQATRGAAQSPTVPSAPARARPYADPASDPWSEASGESVAQKKLIAGLLAIFLGGLGVHKFYLNLNMPGLVMLAITLGVWVLALVLGLLLFVVGVFVTLPLAGLVSTALGIVGLIEGVIYLTKSDADFQRDYLIGKKNWF